MRYIFTILLYITAASAMFSCSNATDPDDEFQDIEIIRENGKVYIVDIQGKRWDVTHAEDAYNFFPNRFQFGLGVNSIPPILNPSYLSPGDPRYPLDHETFLMMATSINSKERAYRIETMVSHEIVDEQFDATYVAIAY